MEGVTRSWSFPRWMLVSLFLIAWIHLTTGKISIDKFKISIGFKVTRLNQTLRECLKIKILFTKNDLSLFTLYKKLLEFQRMEHL